MTSLFPFVKKPQNYFFVLSHAPMNVTDVSIGSINCDPNNADSIFASQGLRSALEGAVLFELHKLRATFSASLCINYRLPFKVYYRICTL